MVLPQGVYRADHVGSWLRPKRITESRKADDVGPDALRKIEDECIKYVVSQQIKSGLRSITDGEFRRAYFHLDFLQKLDGVTVTREIADNSPPVLSVTGKLKHANAIQVDDFEFLKAQDLEAQGATAKVCIPSPTMVHFRGGRAAIDITSYPDMEVFFEDLAKVYQEELDLLYKAGSRFVQLDDTNLAYLCDDKMLKDFENVHKDLIKALPRKYVELINEAISKKPDDMKIGIHLCRGNYRSKWFAEGGYEPVAEVLFRELNVDAYFLEYDDARSGDFAPLRFLPENKVVVLGLMSSKKGALDDKHEIIQRLREAAKFCPRGLDQLCLSHQCGFSSTLEGNDLNEEQQWAKIKLEVAIAKEVWGDDLSK